MNGPLRPSGKEDIYAVVDKYLDYVIHYDQPFVATKYNIQQHIGGDQVSKQSIISLVFCSKYVLITFFLRWKNNIIIFFLKFGIEKPNLTLWKMPSFMPAHQIQSFT